MNTDTHRNGCYDRAPLRGHAVMSLDWREGHPPKAIYINIPHRMSKVCEYSSDKLVGSKDPGCTGCKHKKGTE